MFSKISVVLALAASYASALTIGPLANNITSGGPLTVTWTSSAGDPDVFSIELGEKSFNNFFAIANNVQTSAGSIVIGLGSVPTASDYSLEFVNISNIGQVYASTSSEFAIAAPLSATSTSTTSSSSGVSSSASTVGSGTTTDGSTLTATSSFGIIVSPSSTPSGSNTDITSSTGTSTSTSSSSTGSSFNNGAQGTMAAFTMGGSNAASSLLMVVGAVVGAVFVGL